MFFHFEPTLRPYDVIQESYFLYGRNFACSALWIPEFARTMEGMIVMTCRSRLINQNSLYQFAPLTFIIAIAIGAAGCSMPWNKSSQSVATPDNMMAQQREKSLLPSAYPNNTPSAGMDSRARDIERRLGIK